jgi:AcrR family transcriptional regulator
MARRPAAETALDGIAMLDRLFAAAIECFDRYGIDKTSMEDIAKVAGVSRGTVYRYLGDRRDLITAVVVQRAGVAFEAAREVISEQSTFEDKIVEGTLALVQRGREDEYLRYLLSPENAYLAMAEQSVALNKQTWLPVLEEARQAGVLRADLDVDDIMVWLSEVHFMLAARAEQLPSRTEELRRFLGLFLLPTLIPDGLYERPGPGHLSTLPSGDRTQRRSRLPR